MPHAWFFAALIAAALWGFSYAATGKILESGMPISMWLLAYSAVATVVYFCMVLYDGALGTMRHTFEGNKIIWALIIASVVAAVIANFLITYSISQKNATIASLPIRSLHYFSRGRCSARST
jgi:drug/metabolite transporter (DMT)-like permease